MNDSKIYGAGTISGGTFREVSIAGSGKITGKLTAETLVISGAGKAMDNLDVKTMKVSGTFSAKNIKTQEIKVSGVLKVAENLSSAKAHVSGSLIVKKEANVDDFYLKSSNSEIQALHGDKVTIKRELAFFFNTKHNQIEEIEATTIDIEYVKGKRVSGDYVTIGQGCIIETVEYHSKITVHKEAKIDNIVKLS
ncbi:MAG: hypothetical protein PHG08_02760 [Bacilli bacterium]|jgi:cytoskeletal protein CcmA (bactofilin family)|nr:hypothetical protein [Bacilli bacterium]HHU23580.1 hypothetical protein [Acholeplasmataceae bacterium]